MDNLDHNVLVISESTGFNSNIGKLFDHSKDLSMRCSFVDSIDNALITLKKDTTDLLIVNIKDIDYSVINRLIDISLLNLDIIFMVPEDRYDEIFRKTYYNGILVMKKPIMASKLLEASKLGIQSACRKRKRDFYKPQKLTEICLVDVAKLLLITNEGKNEDEAHRYIEKFAMDLRVTKIRAAEYVIGRYIRYE